MPHDRIETAWTHCRDWVSIYDGMVTETYFLDIHGSNLISTLAAIQDSSISFSLAPEWREEEWATDLSIEDVVRKTHSPDYTSFEVDYVTSEPGFDLTIRLLIDRAEPGLFDADAVWCSDRVFPSGIDIQKRFRDLLRYFLGLQESFKSSRVFIAPENCEDPREAQSPWLEI